MKNILIGAVLLVVIGAIALFMLGGRADAPVQESTNNTEDESASVAPKTLRELMSWDRSAKCSYETADDNASSKGTSYVANGKVRVDGEVTDASTGSTMTMSSIIDGEYVYSWTSGTKQGFKMQIPQDEPTTDGTTTSDTKDIDFDHEYTYTCDSWNTDESVFVIPSDISFVSADELMQGAGAVGGGASGSASMCAACDQAPDASSKAQCKAALGCQ